MLPAAHLTVDPAYTLAEVDDRLYSSFIEHLGRAVYDGIYCPDHPTADADGFRQDVVDLIRPLHIPLMRYPGGNFVSGYRWEDGVGPKDRRPHRLSRAWRALETNEVGPHEFIRWCSQFGAQVMMAVNLGTRGIDAACNLLEYCNHPGGSQYSDLRIAHGAQAPFGIHTWCLGNEMDGPWQIGHKTADEYGRLALETARAMRTIDPSIELVASGSSYPEMPTFPQWEATVLDHVYEDVDYLSLHQYLGDTTHNLQDYLAKSLTTEHFLHSVISTCDYVAARKRSRKRMMLSFDEWNIWYHSLEKDDEIERDTPWQKAPQLVEDTYTMADAVVFGTMFITLLHHADRVRIACLAQLVNVIAPIMTQPGGGPAWRQTIYWPFLQGSMYGRGTVLQTACTTPRYDSPNFTDVPYLESAAVWNREAGELTVFAVNRSLEEDLPLEVDLRAFTECTLCEHLCLAGGADPNAVNAPVQDRAVPRQRPCEPVQDGRATVALPPLSWNVLRLKVKQ